jgi:glutaredoxin
MVIYTKDGCEYCEKLKIILDSFGVNYVTYKLGVDFDDKAFYNEFGKESTFPQVTIDGITMGGCMDTIEYLTAIGCLQEEKDLECTVGLTA